MKIRIEIEFADGSSTFQNFGAREGAIKWLENHDGIDEELLAESKKEETEQKERELDEFLNDEPSKVEQVYQEKNSELELVEEDKRARYLIKHCT